MAKGNVWSADWRVLMPWIVFQWKISSTATKSMVAITKLSWSARW